VTFPYSIFSGGVLFGNSHLPIGKQDSLHSEALVYSSLTFISISRFSMGGHLTFSSRQRSVLSQILTFFLSQIWSTDLQRGGDGLLHLDSSSRTREL